MSKRIKLIGKKYGNLHMDYGDMNFNAETKRFGKKRLRKWRRTVDKLMIRLEMEGVK
jgi:hypothetical protein